MYCRQTRRGTCFITFLFASGDCNYLVTRSRPYTDGVVSIIVAICLLGTTVNSKSVVEGLSSKNTVLNNKLATKQIARIL